MIWLLTLSIVSARAEDPFRFHLFAESQGVDPQVTHSASGDYLFHLIYRGLFIYKQGEGLVPHGAESCTRRNKRLTCRLAALEWSDGHPITAADYVASFRRLVDPATASPQAASLLTLLNARAINRGEKPATALGAKAESERTLVFDFAEDDPEFEHKLTHPALTPYPPGGYPGRDQASKLVVNGPYKIAAWKREAFVRFESNDRYLVHAKRPPAEAWFVDEDATALRLFEAGKLDFLRRLVAREVSRFKGKPEFYQIPVARFDYIGFGPALLGEPKLRSQLVHGVDFKTFLTLFDTRTPPGCPSLPARLMTKTICQEFKPEKQGTKPMTSALNYEFSRMGGEDIQRAAEWFQGQWKKNANINVELHSRDQGSYLQALKQSPPQIFRKGVSLDRPTCMAALEIFTKGNPENYIHFEDEEYEKLTKATAAPEKTERERKEACTKAVEKLLASNRMIPLGEMYFTILANQKFKGWELNELNQLDLSHLERTK